MAVPVISSADRLLSFYLLISITYILQVFIVQEWLTDSESALYKPTDYNVSLV